MIKDKKAYFEFLDDLRASGLINMFGCAPHLKSEYPELLLKEAKEVFADWAYQFGKKKP